MLNKMEENKNEETLSHERLQQHGILVYVVQAKSHGEGWEEREWQLVCVSVWHIICVCEREGELAGACAVSLDLLRLHTSVISALKLDFPWNAIIETAKLVLAEITEVNGSQIWQRVGAVTHRASEGGRKRGRASARMEELVWMEGGRKDQKER